MTAIPPPPPRSTPVLQQDGKFTQVWSGWFRHLYQIIQSGAAGGGSQGPPGPPGPPGATGATGSPGIDGQAGSVIYMEGDTGDDGMAMPGLPGPMGAPGNDGAPGATGPPGPMGFMLDGEQGDDGLLIQGPQGAQGVTGAAGPVGPSLYFEAEQPEEPFLIVGPQGIQGVTGNAGPTGPAVYLEAPEPDEPVAWPGPQGIQGFTGTQGPIGPAVYLEAPEADEPLMFPGVAGPSGAVPGGLVAFAGGLTTITTINDTVTYTTGGITLPSQAAAAGAVWRVQATGQFNAVSSATGRNAQIACFWGSTQLTAATSIVLASTAQATGFHFLCILTGVSTTSMSVNTLYINRTNSTTVQVTSTIGPTATVVTAGSQTIDLRFSMSVAVATDQWLIHQVTIERLL